MHNVIVCTHCQKGIPYDMVNAVLSDACPFCGFAFASTGLPGLKECYADIIDMLPSVGPLEFSTLRSIVQFIFNPSFEKNRSILEKHLNVFGAIFDMPVVEEVDFHEGPTIPYESISIVDKPSPTVRKPPSKKGGPSRIKRHSSDNDAASTDATQSKTDKPAGMYLDDRALEGIPPEFMERAKAVKSDADFQALMHDIVFSAAGDY